MPTYGYRCMECGHTFDARQEVKDRDRQRCPWCNGKTERPVTLPAFHQDSTRPKRGRGY